MTPDDELALVKAQLAVAVGMLNKTKFLLQQMEGNSIRLAPVIDDLRRALARIAELEAEAGRKVVGGVLKNPGPTVDRNDPPELFVPLRPNETPEHGG